MHILAKNSEKSENLVEIRIFVFGRIYAYMRPEMTWDVFFRVLRVQEIHFAPSHAFITHFPAILVISKNVHQNFTGNLGMTKVRGNFYGPRNFYRQQKFFPEKILDLSFHWKKKSCPYDVWRIFSAAALFFSDLRTKPLTRIMFMSATS